MALPDLDGKMVGDRLMDCFDQFPGSFGRDVVCKTALSGSIIKYTFNVCFSTYMLFKSIKNYFE